jgi:hypothetical protein
LKLKKKDIERGEEERAIVETQKRERGRRKRSRSRFGEIEGEKVRSQKSDLCKTYTGPE